MFAVLIAHDNGLLDILVGNKRNNFTNVDLDRIIQEIVSQSLNPLWPGSRKQHGLTFFWSLLYNGSNLWFKTL